MLRTVSLVSTTPDARPWRKRAIPVDQRPEPAVARKIILVIVDRLNGAMLRPEASTDRNCGARRMVDRPDEVSGRMSGAKPLRSCSRVKRNTS
jgi:hypothetical protein